MFSKLDVCRISGIIVWLILRYFVNWAHSNKEEPAGIGPPLDKFNDSVKVYVHPTWLKIGRFENVANLLVSTNKTKL